jgi:hypothetical protein
MGFEPTTFCLATRQVAPLIIFTNCILRSYHLCINISSSLFVVLLLLKRNRVGMSRQIINRISLQFCI